MKKNCLISYSCYSVNSNKNGHILKHLHKNVICNVNNHRSHGRKSIATYFMRDQTHLMFCTVFIPFIYLFYQCSTKTVSFPFLLFTFQWISKQNVKAIKSTLLTCTIYILCMHVYVFLHGDKADFRFNYIIHKTFISFPNLISDL